jgi:hypothetical protein
MNEVYKVKNTMVKGKGHSYNLNNKFDAVHLARTLNQYENETNHNENYEQLKQQIIALQMDISQCQHDLDKIKEIIQ